MLYPENVKCLFLDKNHDSSCACSPRLIGNYEALNDEASSLLLSNPLPHNPAFSIINSLFFYKPAEMKINNLWILTISPA